MTGQVSYGFLLPIPHILHPI